MAVQFHPASGSTIAFGDVVVGSGASSLITVTTTGSTFYYEGEDSAITGPQAAMFGGVFDNFLSPLYGADTASSSISFSPTALGAATATFTWHYRTGTNGNPTSPTLTGTYNLTGTGIANPSPPPAVETTSLLQVFRQLLVPSLGTTGKVLSYYDAAVLNDSADSATYVYKAEDIIADRVPTTRRVVITYLDLGVATLSVSVTAINDNGVVVNQQVSVTLGTAAATGVLATAYADLAVTGYRPQVTLFRAANGGPIAISHVMATGTIEKDVTL